MADPLAGRRTLLLALARASAALPLPALALAPTAYMPVLPGTALRFPQDHGAHPQHRLEWWYVTGWIGDDTGFQITFFRARTTHPDANPSRFAPTQIVFAHAALALAGRERLLHAERAARAGLGLAGTATGDTRAWIGDWELSRDAASGRYRTRIVADDFALELVLTPTRPPLLQGDAGFSRKGPRPEQASHYYSQPQMRVGGRLRHDGRWREADGVAWFDHEWSSEILDPAGAGWDWVGLNLDDGSALMAFRIRHRLEASQPLFATARWLRADGTIADDPAPRFEPLRWWRSPRTGASYPVAMRLTAGDRRLELEPLIDDQELDSRASTGTIYWEGAVRVREDGRVAGRGYLELTGYAGALRL